MTALYNRATVSVALALRSSPESRWHWPPLAATASEFKFAYSARRELRLLGGPSLPAWVAGPGPGPGDRTRAGVRVAVARAPLLRCRLVGLGSGRPPGGAMCLS